LRELLFSLTKKDFEISFFSGQGAGGQHRNRHKNCVRIRHPESGAIGVGQRERSLPQNKRAAFNNMYNSPKFQTWFKMRCSTATLSKQEKERQEKELREHLAEMMKPENIKVEYI
jgi:protein subunit release factor B